MQVRRAMGGEAEELSCSPCLHALRAEAEAARAHCEARRVEGEAAAEKAHRTMCERRGVAFRTLNVES